MLSNAETALLGLLSEQAMYPYQIEKEVEFRDMRFWTELSMSSIYKLLRKLEKEGKVNSEKQISDENRVRKTYKITQLGKTDLREKIKELLAKPEHIRWQVDLGIYNSDLIEPEEVKNSLLNYRAELEKNLQGYQDLEAFLKEQQCPSHRLAVSRRPRYLLKAEMEWVDEFLNTLNIP